MKIIAEFQCDKHGCKKCVSGMQTFPYQEGWKFLYNIQFKTENDQQIRIHGKHFCSTKCLVAYLKDILQQPHNFVEPRRQD